MRVNEMFYMVTVGRSWWFWFARLEDREASDPRVFEVVRDEKGLFSVVTRGDVIPLDQFNGWRPVKPVVALM
jgi:hypothetical protein